jgi:hypothetical protein
MNARRSKGALILLSDLVRLVSGDHDDLPHLQEAERQVAKHADAMRLMYSGEDNCEGDVDELIEERVRVLAPESIAILEMDPEETTELRQFKAAESIALPSKMAAYYLGLAYGWHVAQRLQGGAR